MSDFDPYRPPAGFDSTGNSEASPLVRVFLFESVVLLLIAPAEGFLLRRLIESGRDFSTPMVVGGILVFFLSGTTAMWYWVRPKR